MGWIGEIVAVISVVVLVRKLLLPLCGRVSIWNARLYVTGDVVQIGDIRGRVTHIGPLHTFLAPDARSPGQLFAVSNAEVFRKTIVLENRAHAWDEWNASL
jgi:hypothetical protein